MIRLLLRPRRMLGVLALTAWLAVPVTHASSAEPAPPAPRVDLFGDSLPAGAIARIGTVRWWYGTGAQARALGYLPEGKSLVYCQAGKGLRILDTTTSKELRRIDDQGLICFTLSPDGTILVTASQPPAVRIWEASSGRLLRQLPCLAVAGPLRFSPDGKRLAAGLGQQGVKVWDVATWSETAHLPISDWLYSLVLSDSQTLVTAGKDLRWWDITTGREIQRLKNMLDNGCEFVLSPDGNRLAGMVNPGELHVWDATRGTVLYRKVMSPNRGGFWRLCFSPDGKTLVASGKPFGRTQGMTQFFATETGRELRRWNESPLFLNEAMAFSPDGKFLAQSVNSRIQIRDAQTGNTVANIPDTPVMSVGFGPDGKTVHAVLQRGATASWDALTGKRLTPFHLVPEGEMLLGFSANGKKAALVDAKGALHVWEWATGQRLCRIDSPRAIERVTFSPDGMLVAIEHTDNVIRLWEAKTGRLHCALQPLGMLKPPHVHVFSPDGTIFVTAPGSMDALGDKLVRLWDTHTGKQIGALALPDNANGLCHCLAFSPDGKWLIASHVRNPVPGPAPTDPRDATLTLWDLAYLREARQFRVGGFDVRAVGISPDNKTLAVAVPDTIILWELASGKELGRFSGHCEFIFSVAFSPNGRLLASCGQDYTALVWDLTGLCPDGKPIVQNLSPDDLERLWVDLGGADGVPAYRAIWRMVAAPQAVAFLAKRLKAAAPLDHERINQLITELDSADFSRRDRASKELAELGECAESETRKALAGKPSPEMHRRLETLLEQMTNKILTNQQLRDLRALEVLEFIGTPEARALLVSVANGDPSVRLTIEAKACLQRMSRSPPF